MANFKHSKTVPGVMSQVFGNKVRVETEHVPTGQKTRADAKSFGAAKAEADRAMYRKLGKRK